MLASVCVCVCVCVCFSQSLSFILRKITSCHASLSSHTLMHEGEKERRREEGEGRGERRGKGGRGKRKDCLLLAITLSCITI